MYSVGSCSSLIVIFILKVIIFIVLKGFKCFSKSASVYSGWKGDKNIKGQQTSLNLYPYLKNTGKEILS